MAINNFYILYFFVLWNKLQGLVNKKEWNKIATFAFVGLNVRNLKDF